MALGYDYVATVSATPDVAQCQSYEWTLIDYNEQVCVLHRPLLFAACTLQAVSCSHTHVLLRVVLLRASRMCRLPRVSRSPNPPHSLPE
jgi:hypothetical protein